MIVAKRERLLDLIARREQWRADLDLVRRLHGDVTAAERLLAGTSLEVLGQVVTNETVQAAYDAWCSHLRARLSSPRLGEQERGCLEHFLHVTTNMAPRLFQCYDLAGMPRTNNDMEGFIRSVKTRYRRMSGRKNWNRYLIRYGARIVYYEARVRTSELDAVEERIRRIPAAAWRRGRAEQSARQQEQLKQYRVRHRRDAFLTDLEARWAALEVGT